MSEAPEHAPEPEKPIQCVECGVDARDVEAAEAAGFRFHSDGIGELVSFCRACSAREFGFG